MGPENKKGKLNLFLKWAPNLCVSGSWSNLSNVLNLLVIHATSRFMGALCRFGGMRLAFKQWESFGVNQSYM